MTSDDIQSVLAVIQELANDPEAAHQIEDALYQDFIEHVAERGGEKLARMAREVLRSRKIDFPRWLS